MYENTVGENILDRNGIVVITSDIDTILVTELFVYDRTGNSASSLIKNIIEVAKIISEDFLVF